MHTKEQQITIYLFFYGTVGYYVRIYTILLYGYRHKEPENSFASSLYINRIKTVSKVLYCVISLLQNQVLSCLQEQSILNVVQNVT